MTASWPEMPDFGDSSYDRSAWLVDNDPVELMREHRELLRTQERVRAEHVEDPAYPGYCKQCLTRLPCATKIALAGPQEHGYFDQRGRWVKTGVW